MCIRDRVKEVVKTVEGPSEKVVVDRNAGPECETQLEALHLFWRARYDNPMGRWREHGLQAYWHCAYPDDDLLGGDYSSDLWNDTEECAIVERWIPPTWIPAEELP